MQEIIDIETLRKCLRPIGRFEADNTMFNMIIYHRAARNALLAIEIAARIMANTNVRGRIIAHEPSLQLPFDLSFIGMLSIIPDMRSHSLVELLSDDKKVELSEDSITTEAATRFFHISTLQELLTSPDSPYFMAIYHFTTLKNAQSAAVTPSAPPPPAHGPSAAPAA